MIRLVRAELRKVRTTRLWLGLLLGGLLMSLIGAVVLVAIAGTPEGRAAGLLPLRDARDVVILIETASVISVFALVCGATIATNEYRYGTAAVSALATPARWRVLTAKVLAAVPVGFGYGLAAATTPLVVSAVVFLSRGEVVPFGGAALWAMARVGIQAAYAAAVGVGVGAALRSQLATILSLLGWQLIVEPIAAPLIPDIAKYSPFVGAMGAFGASGEALVPMWTGAGLMLAYIATAWYVAWWLDRRRDV